MDDLNKAGNIDLEKLFEIFDNDDLKYGRKLTGYSSYIRDIENMFNGINTTHLPPNLFKQEMHSFLKSSNIDKNINFLTRTDVYNYMETYKGEDPVKTVVYKQAMKSISDLVYILNKSLFFGMDEDIYFVFEYEQFNLIENSLKDVGIKIEDITQKFARKIKIVKIRIEKILLDEDVNFFINNIVPIDIYKRQETNFFENLESYLDKNGKEKVNYIKYTEKREKYSKTVERRFPRSRSAIEMSIFFLSIFSILIDFYTNKVINSISLFILAVSIIISFDGVLGLIEYYSIKKHDTFLYAKIKQWYNKYIEEIGKK